MGRRARAAIKRAAAEVNRAAGQLPTEIADAIISAMDKTIGQKTVTYDFARLMEGAKEVKCSEFATAMIELGQRSWIRSATLAASFT